MKLKKLASANKLINKKFVSEKFKKNKLIGNNCKIWVV